MQNRRHNGNVVTVSALSVEGAADVGRICVGAIAGPQGVNGRVRIKSFTTAPDDVAAYGPLANEQGDRVFEITCEGLARGMVVARVFGIEDRDAAEALRGIRLYVDRSRLPPTGDENEFYHADLLGLEAEDEDGTVIGRVSAIVPTGSIDVLEIERAGELPSLLIPFTREAVPTVDIIRRRILVMPPDEDEDEDHQAPA